MEQLFVTIKGYKTKIDLDALEEIYVISKSGCAEIHIQRKGKRYTYLTSDKYDNVIARIKKHLLNFTN